MGRADGAQKLVNLEERRGVFEHLTQDGTRVPAYVDELWQDPEIRVEFGEKSFFEHYVKAQLAGVVEIHGLKSPGRR